VGRLNDVYEGGHARNGSAMRFLVSSPKRGDRAPDHWRKRWPVTTPTICRPGVVPGCPRPAGAQPPSPPPDRFGKGGARWAGGRHNLAAGCTETRRAQEMTAPGVGTP
jgi:hypothetical protein